MRSEQRCENAAAIDIADEQAGGIGGMGHAHVDDIALAQIDLRRRAGAFEQNQLIFAAEPSKTPITSGKSFSTRRV